MAYYSDAVVDTSAIHKTIASVITCSTWTSKGLSRTAPLMEFLDFCSLVEGIVLHDHLIAIKSEAGKTREVGLHLGEFSSQNKLESHDNNLAWRPESLQRPKHLTKNTIKSSDVANWNEFLKPLVAAGVLVEEPGYASPLSIGDRPERCKDHLSGSSSSLLHEDAWFETGRLLGGERAYKCSALPMLRQRFFYEKYGNTKEEHSVWNLAGQYKSIADALTKLRESTCVGLRSYALAPIPPIALLLLERSRNPGELLQRSLELRDDYADLRQSLSALRADLADPGVVPNAKLRAIKSWKKSWESMDRYKNEPSRIEIGITSTGYIDFGNSLDGLGFDSLNVQKIIERLMAFGVRSAYSWRVRLLHQAARQYLSTPDSVLLDGFYRLFGRHIQREDLSRISAQLEPQTASARTKTEA
jgi:hypothetical protein